MNGVQEAGSSNLLTRTKNDGNLEVFLNFRHFFVRLCFALFFSIINVLSTNL